MKAIDHGGQVRSSEPALELKMTNEGFNVPLNAIKQQGGGDYGFGNV